MHCVPFVGLQKYNQAACICYLFRPKDSSLHQLWMLTVQDLVFQKLLFSLNWKVYWFELNSWPCLMQLHTVEHLQRSGRALLHNLVSWNHQFHRLPAGLCWGAECFIQRARCRNVCSTAMDGRTGKYLFWSPKEIPGVYFLDAKKLKWKRKLQPDVSLFLLGYPQ